MENRWMWRATNRVTLPLQDTVDTSNTNFKVFCKLGVKSGKRTQAPQLRRNFRVAGPGLPFRHELSNLTSIEGG